MRPNNFQLIFIIVFIMAAVFGVLVFAGIIPIGSDTTTTGVGNVTLWGTVSQATMAPLVEQFNGENAAYSVTYVQKSADTFDHDLLEALAAGQGPDMFFLPDELAFHYANKIYTIPYASYPIASFKNNFVAAGEVFLTDKGTLAFPLTVDPMVMYYNRSILDANNIIFPPTDWDQFLDLVPKLTKKDDANKIIRPAVALGDFTNIEHAKDIISTLFMQLGDKIIAQKDGAFVSVLGQETNLPSALTFYTDFVDPSKVVYSWNKSFPNSRDYFSTDNLAFYFGFGSELSTIYNKNPNQNFLVAPIPQLKNSNFKLTGAKVTGIAISSLSKNFNTAFIAASTMSTGTFAQKLASALGVAPARRDLLAQVPRDAFSPTFYTSALYARSWLNPSPTDTNNIFRNMIESVLSNNMTPEVAIRDAQAKLNLLLLR